MKFYAWNAQVAELDARCIEIERKLEQSALPGGVAESKYLLLYNEAQTLKSRLAMGVSSNEKMDQRTIKPSKDVFG